MPTAKADPTLSVRPATTWNSFQQPPRRHAGNNYARHRVKMNQLRRPRDF